MNQFEVFEITTLNKDGKLIRKRKSLGKVETTDELHAKINELQDEGKTFTVWNLGAKTERLYRRERQNYRVSTQKYVEKAKPKKAKAKAEPKKD